MNAKERAAIRRREWTGEIVQAGQPKGRLLRELPLAGRLLALAALNERVFHGSVRVPRAEWPPGELFDCRAKVAAG